MQWLLMSQATFRFSSVTHGAGISLSEDGLEARCDRLENVSHGRGCGIYIATPLRGDCELEIEVAVNDNSSTDCSLVIGVGQSPTGTNKHLDIPHTIEHARETSPQCFWMNHAVYNGLSGDITVTRYGSTKLSDLKTGDKVAVRLYGTGNLHFLLNGVDQGLAARNVYREDWDTYPVIRVRGRHNAVKITRVGMTH